MKKQLSIYGFTFCLGLLSSSVSTGQSIDQGIKLFQEKKVDQAKEIFEQVLKSNSADPQANYFLGRIYLEFGNVDEAKKMLEKAVKIDEENIDYHFWLADVYSLKTRSASFLSVVRWAGKWKSELEKAFEIDPRNIEARTRIINYYLNAPGIGGGDKKKGTRLAEETVEIDEIQGRLLLADALRKTKKIKAAIIEYGKVLALDSQNETAYNSLGYLFLGQKDYDAALLNFNKYIEVAPDDPNAYDSLGDYFSDREKIDEAIAQYQKAVEIDSSFSVSRFKLAKAFEKRQMKEDAIHHYTTLLELTPMHIRAKDARKRLKDLEK